MANDYSVDEDVWSAYPFWKFHEIDHLIIDIDPDKIEGAYDFEYREEQQVLRRKIQRVLERWRREDIIGRGMKPIDAVEALESHGFKFPHRLSNAVKVKSDLHLRQVSVSSAGSPEHNDTISGLKNALCTSRRLLLAIAIDKFRYNPRSNKNSATRNIASSTQRAGIKVHKDTILNHLRAAYDDLEETEKEGEFKWSLYRFTTGVSLSHSATCVQISRRS